MKILVVDDELYVAAAIKLALGHEHLIESVASGWIALEMLKDNKQHFDLLISDHMMPECAGSELIKRLRLACWRGEYLLLSGYMSPEVEAIYRGLGVEHILTKPFDVAELRRVVAAIAKLVGR